MVVKRQWKVVSGTMAAGVVLVPAGAAFANGGDGGETVLEDTVPVVEYWEFSPKEKAFLEQFFEGQQINLDFLSLSITADSASVPSESVQSESVQSEVSEPSESASEPSPESESASEPSPESESASEPSEESASGESTDSF
jgi:hypothetical protein